MGENTRLKTIITVLVIASLVLPARVPAQEDEKIESFRKAIAKAEELYNEAVTNYENGNSEKAEKYYLKAMQKLYQAKLDPEISYRLKEEFDNLFAKMDGIFQEMNGTPSSYLEATEEELKQVDVTEDVSLEKKYIIPIDPDDKLVRKYVSLYSGSRKRPIIEAFERMGMYREMVVGILKEYGLPEELVYLPVVESLYKTQAYSKAGAVGIWQFMSRTGRNLGLQVNYWIDERKDPEKATRAAAKYLRELFEWFNDWHLALAAYNRGEVGIGKDMKFSKATDFKGLQDTNAIPAETNHFVPKFMACTILGENLADYGFRLNLKTPLEYDETELDQVIDLEIIAKCVGSTVNELKGLNPALSAWCTPKNYPGYKMRLPKGTRETFHANIAKVENLTPTRGVVKYRVKRGDVLGNIARKFRTTAYAIKRDNNVRNVNRIKEGQLLVIRPGRKYFAGRGGGEAVADDTAGPGAGYVSYQVKKGDVLSEIADRFNTTIAAIKKVNGIRNTNMLNVGQVLSIKPGRKYFENRSRQG